MRQGQADPRVGNARLRPPQWNFTWWVLVLVVFVIGLATEIQIPGIALLILAMASCTQAGMLLTSWIVHAGTGYGLHFHHAGMVLLYFATAGVLVALA